MFKSFTKLRGGDKVHNPPRVAVRKPVAAADKDLALAAPKSIVRAVYPYTAQHNDELSFKKNDFFYVNEEPMKNWYIASNPLTGVRGLVPKPYFEVIQRQDSQSVPVSQALQARTKSISGMEQSQGHTKNGSVSSHSSGNKPSLYIYGFILYDFQAERTDELTVNGGESVVITAQSNDEWFVAKPIGRLGGPGLVPVSYIELREVGTDVPLPDIADAVRRAQIPQVDEWKRRLADYKAGSLSLGRQQNQRTLSQASHTLHGRVSSSALSLKSSKSHRSLKSSAPSNSALERLSVSSNHSHNSSRNSHVGSIRSPLSSHSQTIHSHVYQQPYIVRASVDRHAVDGLRYWYLVKMELSNGRFRNLCRYYQDFYDFQIRLLETFPEEAGRTGKARTLPFLPGPMASVQDDGPDRRATLNDYVKELLAMPPNITRSMVVEDLFDLKKGDVESAGPTDLMPELMAGASFGYSGDIPDSSSVDEHQIAGQASHPPAVPKIPVPPTPDSHSISNSNPNSNSNSSLEKKIARLSASSSNSNFNQMPPLPPIPQQQPDSNVSSPVPVPVPFQTSTTASESAPGSVRGSVSSQSQAQTQAQSESTPLSNGSMASANSDDKKVQQNLKIKIYRGDDVFAIVVPSESPFSEIQERICKRLNIESVVLYADKSLTDQVEGAAGFARALNGTNKIGFYVAP